MPNPRFSKSKLRDYLERRIAQLDIEYGFDPCSGASQCKGRGAEFATAYGMREAFLEMLNFAE